MGDISEHFWSDGKQQDTDEDGKPLGAPFNPNDPGAEDQPFHLSGKPTVNLDEAARTSAADVSDGYIHGDGGAYYHPSGYHTGADTAAANGVGLSAFNDDMDGL